MFFYGSKLENELTYDNVVELMLSKGLNRIHHLIPSNQNIPLNNIDIYSIPKIQDNSF